MSSINLHWFRRDLRLHDNTALHYAMEAEKPLLGIFIFDQNILDELPPNDARVSFIHREITELHDQLKKSGSGLMVCFGEPVAEISRILSAFDVEAIYTNRDYEPYAIARDESIAEMCKIQNVGFFTCKDHVIFEKQEILSDTGSPYKVFTPYSRKWKAKYNVAPPAILPDYSTSSNWLQGEMGTIPSLEKMGFHESQIAIPNRKIALSLIKAYHEQRNFPGIKGTSRLGIHLRFGTLSIRAMAKLGAQTNETWLNELIWRDFYMQVLANHPHVVKSSFKRAYDQIPWRNDATEFEAWCKGQTGYPIVDAGMRELNKTGFMHNRVRMITASFLTKHLLIDWRWGEAYFAEKLLDYELASNNGGWQWAAGTGTDAQPYFRVFNPQSQTEKFDKERSYIKKWIPEYGTEAYPAPIVDHKFARQRAIDTYKNTLSN